MNAQTGEPIRRALVSMIGQVDFGARAAVAEGKPSAPPTPVNSSALTDAGGVFRFTALKPGNYFLYASKPEFIPDPAVGQTVTLNENTQSVMLRLAPLGVIEGRVVDQQNLPLRGINIVAETTRVVDGFRDPAVDRNVSTDDRGMFRLWNLQPGKYFLKAAGRSGGTSLLVTDRVTYLPVESFAPVYFGGGGNLESAGAIEVGPGADMHADFTLNMQTGYRIRGRLVNFIPRRPVRIAVLNGAEEVSTGNAAVNVESGQFEIHDIVPGSYTLRAVQGREMLGEAPATVGHADLNDVAVPMASAVEVAYSVRLTDVPKEIQSPGTDQVVQLADIGQENACAIRLHSRQQETPAQVQRAPEPGVIPSVLPSSYPVVIACGNAWVTSATFGTQDLLANPNITIQPGATPPPIEVVAHFGGGNVSGKLVLSEPVSPQNPAGVLLVPHFAGSGGPQMAFAFGQGKDLDFNVVGVAPGDYTAYAFSRAADVEYRSQEFLKTLSGGVEFRIDPDGQTKIAIDKVVR